jgi:hypothetical protein
MTAILVLLPTSRCCLSVRLLDAEAPESGPIWRTRCYAAGTPQHTASMAGAMARMRAWATGHGIAVCDPLGAVIVAPPAELRKA